MRRAEARFMASQSSSCSMTHLFIGAGWDCRMNKSLPSTYLKSYEHTTELQSRIDISTPLHDALPIFCDHTRRNGFTAATFLILSCIGVERRNHGDASC